MNRKNDPKFVQAYERGMLRSALASLFWGAFAWRKKNDGLTAQDFAKRSGVSKHQVSRWFNGDPNWEINTIANIAHALDLDLRIQAVDRKTGHIFTASGPNQASPATTPIATSGVKQEPIKITRNPPGSSVVKDVASPKRAA